MCARYFRLTLTILLGLQTILVASAEILSEQTNLHLCSNNRTIGIQIMTKENGADVSCQCQAGKTRDPWLKEDYVHTPGVGSHKLHTIGKTWNDARKICNEESAYLAIINSKLEESILANMLKNAEKSITDAWHGQEAFIGIHDLYKEGEWVTIFGESLESTGYSSWALDYWGRPQPDNDNGNQNCGAILVPSVGGMDDANCNDKFAFFCELPLTC